MIYSLLVLSPPLSSHGARAAVAFAGAAIARGHSVNRVFFLDNGAATGDGNAVLPQDETDIAAAWREFADTHGVELVLCISSALKRGMLDAGEAARYGKAGATLQPGFEIAGLGQLIDAASAADRLLTFGG
ncbi:sulfurtransferase complex subunit TusD [Haliea sp. E17]|uniref:sulfurtransferase complex subunit TusD n=1 Tax=Haliea sp. E17 TaxID=3401576 RepID=UPI003AAD4AC6